MSPVQLVELRELVLGGWFRAFNAHAEVLQVREDGTVQVRIDHRGGVRVTMHGTRLVQPFGFEEGEA